MGDDGLERVFESEFPTSLGNLENRFGSFSGTVAPDLASVIDAWPTLTAGIRADILAMVQAAAGDGAQG